jgi:hypothetical protein
MEYGELIRQAWRTTWRHRFLWVLGLFAGGVGGANPSCGSQMRFDGLGGGQGAGPSPGGPFGPGEAQKAMDAVGQWLAANSALVVAGAVGFAVLALVWTVLSLIAQGGLAEATLDLAEGRQATLGRAWGTGRRLFWRYAGMYLVLVGIAILVAAVVALLVGLLVAIGSGGDAATVVAVLLGLLVGVPLVLLGIVAAIALGIVVTYAQRAIPAEDVGPLAALGSGWRMLRGHPGESFLVWLISLALGVAGAVVVGLILAVLGIPLVLVGIGLWNAAGTGTTVVYGLLALLLVLLVGALVGAVLNTFFWSYWSGAFVRLRGGPPAVV